MNVEPINGDLKDEIDLNNLFITLLRNRKLIIIFTVLTTLITGLFSFNRKAIWEGGFNILVEDSNQSLKQNSGIILIGGVDKPTQEFILNSSSVLKPAYNFYKDYNFKRKSESLEISFEEWKSKFLKINFEDDTFILSVNYQNIDKRHILNMLNLISGIYQDYSMKEIKNIKPWVIVSNPIIKENPVGPRKLRITIILLIFSFILSSLFVLIKDKVKGDIHDADQLIKNIPYELIETIYINDPILIANIIKKKSSIQSTDKVGIITLSNSFFKNNFKSSIEISKTNLNYEFINFNSLQNLKDFKSIVLLAEKGKINHNNLKLMNNYLGMYRENIDGFLIIDF